MSYMEPVMSNTKPCQMDSPEALTFCKMQHVTAAHIYKQSPGKQTMTHQSQVTM